jgi:hypothetical protein
VVHHSPRRGHCHVALTSFRQRSHVSTSPASPPCARPPGAADTFSTLLQPPRLTLQPIVALLFSAVLATRRRQNEAAAWDVLLTGLHLATSSSSTSWLLQMRPSCASARPPLPASDPVLHLSARVCRGAVAGARPGLA